MVSEFTEIQERGIVFMDDDASSIDLEAEEECRSIDDDESDVDDFEEEEDIDEESPDSVNLDEEEEDIEVTANEVEDAN